MKIKKLLAMVIAAAMILTTFGITSMAAIGDVITVEAEAYANVSGSGSYWASQNEDGTIKGIKLKGGGVSVTPTYTFNVSEAGVYELKAKIAFSAAQYTNVAIDGAKIKLIDDDKGNASSPNAGYETDYVVGTVELKVGNHVLTWEHWAGDEMFIDNFTFTKTADIVVEATIDAVERYNSGNYEYVGTTPSWGGINNSYPDYMQLAPSTIQWTVDIPEDGIYTPSFNAGGDDSTHFYLYVDGAECYRQEKTALSAVFTAPEVTTLSNVNLELRKGSHTVKLTTSSNGGVFLDWIKFTKTGELTEDAILFGVDGAVNTTENWTLSNGVVEFYSNATGTYNIDVEESGTYKLYGNVNTGATPTYTRIITNGVASDWAGSTWLQSGYNYEYYGQIHLSRGMTNTITFECGASTPLKMNGFKLVKVETFDVDYIIEPEIFTSIGDWWRAKSFSNSLDGKYVNFSNSAAATFDINVNETGAYDVYGYVNSKKQQYVTVKGADGTLSGEVDMLDIQDVGYTLHKLNNKKVVNLTADKTNPLTLANGSSGSDKQLEMDFFALKKVGDIAYTLNAIDATERTGNKGEKQYASGDNRYSFQVGDALSWTLNVDADGAHDIYATLKNISSTQFTLYVDDEKIEEGAWALSEEGVNDWTQDPQYVRHLVFEDINLDQGSRKITLEIADTSVNDACLLSKVEINRVGDKVIPPARTMVDYLADGPTIFSVDTSAGASLSTLYAAVYYNNRLVDIAMQNVSANTTNISLKAINAATAEEKAKYSVKLFLWGTEEAGMYMVPLSSDLTWEALGDDNIYVSQANGDDANAGTVNSPVATIAKAQELANGKTRNVNINIVGEYSVTEPITVTAENNHTSGGTITYTGGIINGGKTLDLAWEPHTAGIYKATVTDTDVTDIKQLWVDGVKANRASSGLIDEIELYYNNETPEGIKIPETAVNGYQNIINEENLELVWDVVWARHRFAVSKGNMSFDAATGKITLKPENYTFALNNTSNTKPDSTKPFRIENALYFLDEANEFYYDSAAKVLYYMNSAGTEPTGSFVVPVSEGLLQVTGTSSDKVENVYFKDMTFKYGAWNERPDSMIFGQADQILVEGEDRYTGGDRTHAQIEVNYADNVHFDNVDVNHVGSAAYSLTNGVENSSIKNSDIIDTAAGGIMVGDWRISDSTKDKFCINNDIQNNIVQNIAHEYGGQCGIAAYYVWDTDISNNTISDVSYTGISLGWGWSLPSPGGISGNTITANYITDYMDTTKDGAAIYTLGKSDGETIISKNHILDVKTFDEGAMSHGLYADTGSTKIHFTENVVENSPQWLWARGWGGLVSVEATNNYVTDPESLVDVNGCEEDNVTKVDTIVIESNYKIADKTAEVNAIKENAGATR